MTGNKRKTVNQSFIGSWNVLMRIYTFKTKEKWKNDPNMVETSFHEKPK